jgi:hypothetical protein
MIRLTLLMSMLTLFLTGTPALALGLNQNAVETEGVIRVMNSIQCTGKGETLCENLCGAKSCEWPEPLCRDCFGSGDAVMRDVFQTLVPTYEGVEAVTDRQVVYKLLTRSTVLVANKSLYDFYNGSEDAGIAPHLQTLCGSRDGFIAVELDEEARPTSAFLAICTTPTGIAARRLRPVSSSDLTDNEENVLKLKLSTELRLSPPN